MLTLLSQTTIVIALSLFIFSILAFALWKKHNQAWLLHIHLFFLISPLFLLALRVNCTMSFIGSFLSFCTMVIAQFILYFLPPLIALTFVTGYFIIPKLYHTTAKQHTSKQFSKLCKRVGIHAKLFLIDKAQPEAFTLGKSVFLSVGMFETLTHKEREAVILHELAHVKERSAWNKFSTAFAHLFSPIAWFSTHSPIESEEIKADAFAAKIQGTNKFLMNAKKKVNDFC